MQREKSATWIEWNMKKMKYEKSAIWEECDMKTMQHEKSATWKECHMKRVEHGKIKGQVRSPWTSKMNSFVRIFNSLLIIGANLSILDVCGALGYTSWNRIVQQEKLHYGEFGTEEEGKMRTL